MRRYLIAGVVTLIGISAPAAPVFAQAKASAEASAASSVNPKWTAPKTAWGHPDLEGIWTSDDMRGVPMARPTQFGTRRYLTDEEFFARAQEREAARKVDNARTGTFRNEEGTRDFGYTSMVIDPPDGRIPALTAEARTRPPIRGTSGVGPFNTIDDFSLWDRCVTRGLAGSWLPVVYGNGTRIMQTPDSVVIFHEMVHETRVIPLDNRPAASNAIKSYIGEARGHFEGDTLVVVTTNYLEAGAYGGASSALKTTERFKPSGPNTIDWSIKFEDPHTWTRPWSFGMLLTRDPQSQLFEYACHEGNEGMRGMLKAARESEKKR